MKRTCLVISMLLSIGFSSYSQDQNLTQFFVAPLKLNPALTGQTQSGYSAGIHHRNQWSSVGIPFQSSMFYGDVPLKLNKKTSNFFSAGLLVYQSKSGKSELKNFNAEIHGSYHVKINRNNSFVSGLKLAYNQYSINFEELAWDSQYNGVAYDPSLPNNETFGSQSEFNIDGGLGLLWTHKDKLNYQVGYSLNHYFQTRSFLENGTGQEFIRQQFHVMIKQPIQQFDLELHSRFMAQGGAREITVALIGGYRYGLDSKFTTHLTSSAIKAGLLYRVGDAIAPIIGYEYQRTVAAYLSYDLNISSLNSVSNYRGAWEVSIQYKGLLNDNRIKLK